MATTEPSPGENHSILSSNNNTLQLVVDNMRKQEVIIFLFGWLFQVCFSLGYATGYLPMYWGVVVFQLFQNFFFFFLFGRTVALSGGKKNSKGGAVLGTSNTLVSAPGGGDAAVPPRVNTNDKHSPPSGGDGGESSHPQYVVEAQH